MDHKELNLESLKLMGIPLHVKGDEWPELPFYGSHDDGTVFVRWNDADVAYVLSRPAKGDLKRETVEYWAPSTKIEQAMRLWTNYPPKTQWIEIEIGDAGWIVRLLYHMMGHQSVGFVADDNTKKLPEAITEAWIIAMRAQ
jgi:hypothetical protein